MRQKKTQTENGVVPPPHPVAENNPVFSMIRTLMRMLEDDAINVIFYNYVCAS
jgi:hypothetical protein